MIGERTERGFEARLRPGGIGRFFSAAFLLAWICGWAVGEAFALWMLVRGAIALITGAPIEAGRNPLAIGPALAIGAFLLFWLAIWTVGGVAAIAEFLRLLWSEDRIVAGPGELEIEHRIGPFRSREVVHRADLRDIKVFRRLALVAETASRRIELTRLGTLGDREQLAESLHQELRLESASAAAESAELPEGWREVVTPEGVQVLINDPAVRAKQARVAALIAFLMVIVASFLIRQAVSDPKALGGAIFVSVIAAALVWGAAWLARGRKEWRLDSGQIVLQRRFGASVREQFVARRLELNVHSDSDGDDWYAVEALASAEPAPPAATPTTAAAVLAQVSNRGRDRRSILKVMNDDSTVRRLAHWLARRTNLPVEDRSTPASQAITLAQLRTQLAASGRFGRLAGGLIDRLEERSRRG